MDDRNAGLALIQAAIAMLIPFAIGYLVFRLVKPSTNYWEKSPNNYGRLFLAYTLLFLIWGLGSLTFLSPAGIAGINFLALLAFAIPTVGSLSYFIGYLYGKSKPAVDKLAEEAKTITKTVKDKSVKKPIKKTVEKPQELKTDGLLATCIQHEIDHLEGILFIDYLSKLKKTMIVKKLTKQKKNLERIIV